MEDLQTITDNAITAIADAQNPRELDAIRVQFLGKKGELTSILKQIGKMSHEERISTGKAVNVLKQQINQAIAERDVILKQQQLEQKLQSEKIDITLPGRRQSFGSLHPITLTRQRIEMFFGQLGFEVVEGPEVETDFYNFEALNIPAHHPAKAMHDTFYFGDGRLLRTHTSNVQIRHMEQHKPPFRIIAPGRTYRCDSDLTHTPMFHQVEMLLVDEHANFAELKGLIYEFISHYFERDLDMRFRPSYFPFTEPSAEVDIECVECAGKGCRICGHTGWLEIMGCGMVHPNVLASVNLDSEKYSGYAFGLGIERLAMLRYQINDIRVNYESDLRYLSQF